MNLVSFFFFCIFSIYASAAELLSTPGVDANSPRIGVDASGNEIAVWIENGYVKSRTRLNEQSWQSIQLVSHYGAAYLEMVFDTNGNATALWIEDGCIKTASKTLSGSWSSIFTLSSEGASSPHLAADESGNVVAVWARAGNIESATKIFGEDWPITPNIISESPTSSSPKVAMGQNGTVIAVWQGIDAGIYAIFAAKKIIGNDWDSQEILSEPMKHSVKPNVAVDLNGRAAAVWFQYEMNNGYHSKVILQKACFDQSWSPSESISSPGFCDPKYLKAVPLFDKYKDLLIVWSISFDGSIFSIESETTCAYLNLTHSDEIAAGAYLFDFDAAIYLNGDGDSAVVYQAYNSEDSSIYLLSQETDLDSYKVNNWTGILNQYAVNGNNGSPRVAGVLIGSTLKKTVVWENYDGSFKGIYGRSDIQEFLLPPENVAVVQYERDFGIFLEKYNVLTWTPSPSTHVFGYVISRNGIFLDFVGKNTLEYVDHNRDQEESIYEIASIDRDWKQSVKILVQYP